MFLTGRVWPRFQNGFCYLRLYKVHCMLSNIPDPERPEALEPKPLTESPRIRSEPRCEFRWAHSEYLWCYIICNIHYTGICSVTMAKNYQWRIYIVITLSKSMELCKWFRVLIVRPSEAKALHLFRIEFGGSENSLRSADYQHPKLVPFSMKFRCL